jgi:hypothetical protein
MSDEPRSPVEQALDVLFYAPIGLALNAEELVGQMAARGRQSVMAAKFIGRMAVQQGRTEVDKALDRIQDQAATLVDQLGQLSGVARPGPAATVGPVAEDEAAGPVDAIDITEEAAAAEAAGAPAAVDVAGSVDPDADVDADPPIDVPVDEVNRAIPDYDSLAASQVVPRLDGLTSDELEVVRGYESAHRNRTTVLTRVAQLQRQ